MAQALAHRLGRQPRDEGALEAARGIVTSAFVSLVFVWIPIAFVLSQCAHS